MGYLYKVETLEVCFLEEGIYLMNIGTDTNEDNAFPTKVAHASVSMLMPIHFRGAYNKAKVVKPTQLVTIFTPLDEVSVSDKIDLEWAVLNGDIELI